MIRLELPGRRRFVIVFCVVLLSSYLAGDQPVTNLLSASLERDIPVFA